MLSVLAALIPVIGSLYVAASVLLEQRAFKRERRVRERVRPRVAERREWETQRARRPDGGVDFDEVGRRVQAWERQLLGYYGVAPRPTVGDVDLRLSLSGEIRPQEAVRQWVLIISAVVGVVLIGIDQSITTTGG